MSNIPIKQLNKKEVAFYPKTNVAAIVDLNKGMANGVASLDETGKVPSSQLPSYVDDVIVCPTKEQFPSREEAEPGKIYIAMDTNKTYRWAGTLYVEISESIAVGTTTGTAYPGELGAQLAEQVSTLDERISTIEADAFSGSYNDLTDIPENLVQDNNYIHTDNNFTSDEKNKLQNISNNAEANVQGDWKQNDVASDDYIKNRTHWEEDGQITINAAKLAWNGTSLDNFDFYFYDTDVHLEKTNDDAWEFDWNNNRIGVDLVHLEDPYIGTVYVYFNEVTTSIPISISSDPRNTTPQPLELGVDIITNGTIVHKLDNKFIDLDVVPTVGSNKPVTSNGVAQALEQYTITETDPTVPSWAKSENKPVYTAAEVGALPASTVIPSKLSDLTNDAGYLTSSDIDGKADISELGVKVIEIEDDPLADDFEYVPDGTFEACNEAFENGKVPILIFHVPEPDSHNLMHDYTFTCTEKYDGSLASEVSYLNFTFDHWNMAIDEDDAVASKNYTFEGTKNKVKSISSSSTDTQYPSAKCVYDQLQTKLDVSRYELNEEVISASLNDLDVRINNKQDAISDLSTIRSGAASGATAYQKPSTGIPASDLASGVIPDISEKVDKVEGKGLSTNDYTDEDKALLNDLEPRVETLEYEHKYYTLHFTTGIITTDNEKQNAIKAYDIINSWKDGTWRPRFGTKDIVFGLKINNQFHHIKGLSYTFSRSGNLQLNDTISVIGFEYTDDATYTDTKYKFQLRVVNVTYDGETKLGIDLDPNFTLIEIKDEIVTPTEKTAWNDALNTIAQLTSRIGTLEGLVSDLSNQVQQLQNP